MKAVKGKCENCGTVTLKIVCRFCGCWAWECECPNPPRGGVVCSDCDDLEENDIASGAWKPIGGAP